MSGSPPTDAIHAHLDIMFNGVIAEGFACGNFFSSILCVHQKLTVYTGLYTFILVQAICMYLSAKSLSYKPLQDILTESKGNFT